MKVQNLLPGFKHYHFIIIIALMIIVVGFEIAFLYNYVYISFDISKIKPSGTEHALERVHIEEFRKLDALHEAKEKSRLLPSEIRDPFVRFVEIIPTPPTSPSTTPSSVKPPPR